MKTIKSLALMGLAAVIAGCGQKSSSEPAAGMKPGAVAEKPIVRLATVREESVDQLQVYSATVKSDVKNNIAPSSPLRIEKILVEVGDRVRKGQELVRMDNTNLIQLELQLKNTEIEFNRIEQLYQIGACSQADYDNMKMSLEVSKSQYEYMKSNIRLLSPIDGVVTARNYDNGDNYTATPILEVQSISQVKVTVNVSERYFADVKKGNDATLELEAYPGVTFHGKVSLVYPTIDATTHTFPVEIMVSNSDNRVRPGMFARVTMNLGTYSHVVVPDIAVEKRQGSGDRFVYVYQGGKVYMHKVELGQRLGDRYELLSGVDNNAQIVVAGQKRLSDGIEVEVEK